MFEAEPVDDGVVRCRAKQARGPIAALRARRQRADLDEAEAESKKLARHPCVLIEARRHAERIGNLEAEHGLGQTFVVGLMRARIKSEIKTFDGKLVTLLRRKREEQCLASAEQPIHRRARRDKPRPPLEPSTALQR